jgi:hypothetical protein
MVQLYMPSARFMELVNDVKNIMHALHKGNTIHQVIPTNALYVKINIFSLIMHQNSNMFRSLLDHLQGVFTSMKHI